MSFGKEIKYFMATIITNRASISYNNGTASITTVSNTTTASVNEALSIQKSSLTETYRVGDDLTYVITLQNSSEGAVTNVVVTDDLGSYDFNGSVLTPLSYGGSAQLYINGSFVSALTPVISASNIVFSIASIPAGGNAQIIYNATVNDYASGGTGSFLTNTASVAFECDCLCNQGSSDSETVVADSFAELRLIKSVCPNPIICGDRITYVIDIYNYGNIAAEGVVLTDTFTPPLEDIVVSVDGTIIPATDYTYVDGLLTLPAAESGYSITVPAASFVQNPVSGIFETTPGQVQIIISGS